MEGGKASSGAPCTSMAFVLGLTEIVYVSEFLRSHHNPHPANGPEMGRRSHAQRARSSRWASEGDESKHPAGLITQSPERCNCGSVAYSMTRSARARTLAGTLIPSALA